MTLNNCPVLLAQASLLTVFGIGKFPRPIWWKAANLAVSKPFIASVGRLFLPSTGHSKAANCRFAARFGDSASIRQQATMLLTKLGVLDDQWKIAPFFCFSLEKQSNSQSSEGHAKLFWIVLAQEFSSRQFIWFRSWYVFIHFMFFLPGANAPASLSRLGGRFKLWSACDAFASPFSSGMALGNGWMRPRPHHLYKVSVDESYSLLGESIL